MAEYALGAIRGKEGKVGFMNFLINITPDCDCVPWSDAPIVPDIGIVASKDPVAIDAASFDLVNRQMGLAGSLLETNLAPGEDKFKGLRCLTDGCRQLRTPRRSASGRRTTRLIESERRASPPRARWRRRTSVCTRGVHRASRLTL